VERLRKRQIKNFLSVLFLAIGTPMILMGDEVRRTQKGNNNAYCQDNELSWFDWSLVQQHKDIHRFAKSLIQSRVNGESKTGNEFITLNESIRQAEIRWHGVELNRPDWGEDSHVIAVSAANLGGGIMVHVMLNAYWESLLFELPPSVNSTNGWYRWIDTALESPHDISEWNNAPKVSGSTYRVQARSLVALFAGQEVSKTQNQ
jgi:glycogen operon protein